MAASEPDLADGKDYAIHLTLDEVLQEVIAQAEKARHASSPEILGLRVKMMSRAARCALEIYGDWFAHTVPKEEAK